MGDRADAIFWELDETINRTENPSLQQQNLDLDELSVPFDPVQMLSNDMLTTSFADSGKSSNYS